MVLPAEDGGVRFLDHRWVTRDELVELQPLGRFDLCREAWPPDLVEPLLRRIEPSAEGVPGGKTVRIGCSARLSV